jgi:hypothetical protein
MKILSAIAVTVLLAASNIQWATPSAAGEEVASAPATQVKENRTTDCSKENWPNFSPPCLRNTDRSTEVRQVVANRP